MISSLQSLGFTINEEKSSLIPSQVVDYLGFRIDSKSMMIKLPKHKIKDLIQECKKTSQKLIAFLRTAKRQEHWSEDARLKWYYRTFPGKHRTIGIVDQEPTSMERTKSYSRGTKDNSIHRRFDLGRVLRGLCNTWKMAKNGIASSHQHSRVKSDLIRSSSLQRFKGPTDYDTHRQYNMRCLHKSSGRNNFYFTVKDSERAMDSLSGTECSLKSRTHPRNSEFNGGSSFSNEDRQIRLEVENQLVQDVQSNLGTTSYRPLCKSSQYTTDEVLFLYAGSKSGGSECFSSELGTHEFVGQPSMDTYSKNISQSNQKQGHDNDISLVRRFPESQFPEYTFSRSQYPESHYPEMNIFPKN
ncbi:hypothetical protein RhiirC2_795559 [Rhizophagus irregularis]|uniref:Reverse transcriptase domain-containing protein n=1 Tax=Rhizophagus irregularis TaxID=588596 RepID=A0A2N1MBB3_9GLOM|nr:hypothetical protein RhiirC2_795559 [Rhizophagus irregularis]